MNVIYCFDAYCGWSYAFRDTIINLKNKFSDDFDFTIVSGGMILPDQPVPISVLSDALLNMAQTVTAETGQSFGKDFLWHLENPDLSDWFPSSEKPAIALSIIKTWRPEVAFEFASDMQYGLFEEGRDLTDNEAYRHLLKKYEIDVDNFYDALLDPAFQEKASHDFNIVKQLKVTGFPALFVQVSMDKFYLMSNGFIAADIVEQRFHNILAEINN